MKWGKKAQKHLEAQQRTNTPPSSKNSRGAQGRQLLRALSRHHGNIAATNQHPGWMQCAVSPLSPSLGQGFESGVVSEGPVCAQPADGNHHRQQVMVSSKPAAAFHRLSPHLRAPVPLTMLSQAFEKGLCLPET